MSGVMDDYSRRTSRTQALNGTNGGHHERHCRFAPCVGTTSGLHSAPMLAAIASNASQKPAEDAVVVDPMSEPIVAVCVPLDDSNDPAVLADVIAFLDGFDDAVHVDMGPMRHSTLASPPVGPRLGAGRRRSRAAEVNRARVERYWKKKDELELLRKQVAYLSSTLEKLKRATGACLEVKSARGLLVTVGRTRGVDWKCRADREKELRSRAEKTNAQLREVLRTHELWRCGISKQLRTDWPGSAEGCYAGSPLHSSSFVSKESRDRTWSRILKQLKLEAAALRMANSSQPPTGLVDIIGVDHILPTPTIEWASSFSVPMESPQKVGRIWWDVLQKRFLAPRDGVNVEMTKHDGDALHMEKRVKWSVLTDNNQELRLSTLAMFEVTETHSHWTMAATSDVFDAERKMVLFRTTSLKVITQARAPASPSCVFWSRYRIHDVSSATAARFNREELPVQRRNKELAVNAWKDMMRSKDQHLRRDMLERCGGSNPDRMSFN